MQFEKGARYPTVKARERLAELEGVPDFGTDMPCRGSLLRSRTPISEVCVSFARAQTEEILVATWGSGKFFRPEGSGGGRHGGTQ